MRERNVNRSLWSSLTLTALLSADLIALGGLLVSSGSSTLSHSTLYAAIGLVLVAATVLGSGLARALRRIRRLDLERQAEGQRFQALVDGIADHALYLLDVAGVVVSWNAGAQRVKGFTASEVIGQHYSLFFSTEEKEAGIPQKGLESAARLGKFETEGWRIRRDGSRFYSSAVLAALRDADGTVTGYANITRDITERVQRAQELEQTRAALNQAQKMEALGQLTGGMAHDFNNLLHVINNALQILRLRIQHTDPDTLRYLEMARRSADRAAGITQRLLAFARRQPLDPKPVNVNRLLQAMGDMLRHVVGDGVSVETVFSSGLWSISADANQLETAVLNLTINSRDAMSRTGKLTIETANALLDEVYAASHTEVVAGQYVMIAVSDTGMGMSQEVASKAFEPFFTTKEAQGGTGLGLSQVFGFVKQSGGHVKIYSESGEGTTVKIYLPRLTAAGGYLAADALASRDAGNGEVVLVVEDHDDVRAFAVEMLTSLGYRVSAAPDAATALQLLSQLPRIDLLFTDVGLPNGMNGRQLADEVRKGAPDVRVLFTTGYARNAIVHHGRLDAGVELLLKPYTQSDLARKVSQVLAGRATALSERHAGLT